MKKIFLILYFIFLTAGLAFSDGFFPEGGYSCTTSGAGNVTGLGGNMINGDLCVGTGTSTQIACNVQTTNFLASNGTAANATHAVNADHATNADAVTGGLKTVSGHSIIGNGDLALTTGDVANSLAFSGSPVTGHSANIGANNTIADSGFILIGTLNATYNLDAMGGNGGGFTPGQNILINNLDVDGTALLHSAGFVQPFTSLMGANVYGYLGLEPFKNPGGGGVLLGGISNVDASAVTILSLVGTNGAIDSAATEIVAAKSNGSTGMTALSDTDEMFELTNCYNPNVFYVMGNGDTHSAGKYYGDGSNLTNLNITVGELANINWHEAHGVTFDGGGSAIAANSEVGLNIVANSTITGARITSYTDSACNINVDVLTGTNMAVLTDITGANYASLSASNDATANITGWSNSLTRGSLLVFKVVGVPTCIGPVGITLDVTRGF